jgi:hypothetical protein
LLDEWPDFVGDGRIMGCGGLNDLIEVKLDVGNEFIDFSAHSFR